MCKMSFLCFWRRMKCAAGGGDGGTADRMEVGRRLLHHSCSTTGAVPRKSREESYNSVLEELS